jgi:metal transporter CNNM
MEMARKPCGKIHRHRHRTLSNGTTLLLASVAFSGVFYRLVDNLIVKRNANIRRLSFTAAKAQIEAAGFRVCSVADINIGSNESDESTRAMLPSDESYHSLQRVLTVFADENDHEEHGDWTGFFINALCSLICVCVAALAAGLTLGMLALDPLMLLIKERAAISIDERMAAKRLLPIVQQHHRLLVTLLLMNSIANEALPIFLEKLIPPAAAVIVSVTMVLFFGEIIPSAIFTGPNQLNIANSLVPLVKVVLFIFYPIAGPIAKLLDWILHEPEISDNGELDGAHHAAGSAVYSRGELAAMIRIHYEERMAAKRKRKREKALVAGDHVGALDFTPPLALSLTRSQSKRAVKNQVANEEFRLAKSNELHVVDIENCARSMSDLGEQHFYAARDRVSHESQSIHADEVLMVEGALQMFTSFAIDVFTPMRRVFSIPQDMILTEHNMVKIFASGFSRVLVHEPGMKNAIVGVLITKMLIVVDPKDKRKVGTLPLRIPKCVGPSEPLVNLVNLFQSGGQLHLALVCARPSSGNNALSKGLPLPETAGLMGIITLEDVLEMLLQEQIYDEMDHRERQANQLALKVVRQWRNYIQRKKLGTLILPPEESALIPVVKEALAAAHQTRSDNATKEEGLFMPTEMSALLSTTKRETSK